VHSQLQDNVKYEFGCNLLLIDTCFRLCETCYQRIRVSVFYVITHVSLLLQSKKIKLVAVVILILLLLCYTAIFVVFCSDFHHIYFVSNNFTYVNSFTLVVFFHAV